MILRLTLSCILGLLALGMASPSWAPAYAATLFTDQFNRANGGLGANWTTVSGFGAPQIRSNVVETNAIGTISFAVYTGGAISNDQVASIKLTRLDSNTGHVVVASVRGSSSARTQYECHAYGPANSSTATLQIVEVVAGVASIRVNTGATATVATTNVMSCEVVGTTPSTVKLYIDGVERLAYEDASPILSGSPGVGVHGSAGTTPQQQLDTFVISDPPVLPRGPESFYMDCAATGVGDGTSWTDAWPNFQNMSTIMRPGDTVWLSGGTVSQTCNTTHSLLLDNGTAGNPITYRISQEAGHNGILTVNVPNTSPYHWIFTRFNPTYGQWVTIDGEVEGVSHLIVNANIFANITDSQGFHARYVTTSGKLIGYGADSSDFGYMYWTLSDGIDGVITGLGATGTKDYPPGPTRNRLHHSIIETAQDIGGGDGDDGMQNPGNITIDHNRFIGIDVESVGANHADGIQGGGSNVIIRDNYFTNIHNDAVFILAFCSPYPPCPTPPVYNVSVFNNVFHDVSGGNVTIGTHQDGAVFTDVNVFNNTIVRANGSIIDPGVTFDTSGGGAGTIFTSNTNHVVNNIFYNILNHLQLDPAIVESNNTDGTAGITFVNPASDWHLEGSSSAAIDQGISPAWMTAITIQDADGFDRSDTWDIGAYEFAGVPPSGDPPAAPASIHMANFRGSTFAIPIWTHSTDTDWACTLVYRSTVSGTYGAPIATITAASAAASHTPLTQYTDSRLYAAGTYYYTIAFCDVDNNISDKSSEVSITVTGKQ